MRTPYCRQICRQPEKHGYIIHFRDGQESAITCFCCGRLSNHPMDVRHRYCNHCHVFHDIVMYHMNGMLDLLREMLRLPTDSEEEAIDEDPQT